MNQPGEWSPQTSQPYSAPSYPSQTTTPAMNAYQSYTQPSAGSSHGYGSNSYGSQYYSGPMLSPPSAGHPPSMSNQLLPLSGIPSTTQTPYSSQPTASYAQGQPHEIQDTSGQVAPPGHKPKVTATLWEDEGTICFQVECDGLCVARRDDSQFINGTKLLNVAGMTRGRRDGILKSEKTRQVVKIGPMHLKGVWIPFDRALEFANREKITGKLYPLFVHNISNLLPQGQIHRNATLQNRTKLGMGPHPGSVVPSLSQHPSMQLPSQITGNQRPSIDRAHTFPTPPTSASSVINHGNDYWNSSSINGGMQSGQPPMNLDNGMNNTRSMPSTPASTPPGTSMQSLAGYSSLNTAAQSSVQYNSQYGPSNSYLKNEMGPPSRSSTVTGNDQKDIKPDPFSSGQSSHESTTSDHGGSYSQESGPLGNGNHTSFSFNGLPGVPIMSNHSDATDSVSSTTHHDTATGQITPRTSIGQDQWTGYHTPPRTNTYPGSAYPSTLVNGSNKRSRDDDDGDFKLSHDLDGMKRHKSGRDDILGSRTGIMQHVGR